MTVSGIYYPPPPVFVGGWQPYAPLQPTQQPAVAAATPGNIVLRQAITLYEIVSAWQPGPFIVIWGMTSGTSTPPPPPLPPEALSAGLLQLFPVLRSWEPVPLPLSLVLPRTPLPVQPPQQTAPYFNTGQIQMPIVLGHWEATARLSLLPLPLLPKPVPLAPLPAIGTIPMNIVIFTQDSEARS